MRGKPFESGNKLGKGRPPGSRNKKTKLAESLASHGEAILQQCKLQALKGDPTAMRLCIERLIPVAKPPGTRFRLPAMQSAADLKNVLPGIVKEASKGRLNAFEAEAIARLVESHLRTLEAVEFGERIRALEEAHSRQQKLDQEEREQEV